MTWNRWSHSSICNKNDANKKFSGWYKIGFEIKNEIEGHGQSSPKISRILRVLRCIIGPNLEILSWIGGERWHGQAQNMAIFYFEVNFDLEVQGQLTPKTIGILTKVFSSSGPNLVILAWTGDKLSCGQASDYRTHRRTHRQTQATTIPEGQNWPRVIRWSWDCLIFIRGHLYSETAPSSSCETATGPSGNNYDHLHYCGLEKLHKI